MEDTLYVQSHHYLNGKPLFLIKIFKNLNFETYHCGIKCTISTLSKNRVMTVHAWSIFEEITLYLKNMKIDCKNCVLLEHRSTMALTVIEKRNVKSRIYCKGIPVFCNTHVLVQSTRNRLSITVHQNTEQNNIKGINFK